MTTPKLARLERVSLRDAWKSEPADFTPWLAREENLALLAETLEMELELEAQEREVGPFRADILCTDSSTGDWVLIENQLERTDHTHLGQLLTYAAGLKAVTIVWIADGFADEHRAALDWLNEITDDTVNFFGLEIELWRIGGSDLAPKFNVKSQPNDWTRRVKEQSQNLGSTEQLQLEFWTAFSDFLEKNGSAVRPNKAAAASWMTFRSGIRRLGLGASVSVQKKKLWAEVNTYYPEERPLFEALEQKADVIAEKVGSMPTWPMSAQSYSTILLDRDADIAERTSWQQDFIWLESQLRVLRDTVEPLVDGIREGSPSSG